MKNITKFFSLFILLMSVTTSFSQAPTVTATSPTNVTYRTTMTITGTNFTSGTSVNFYASGSSGTSVAALSTTYVSSTKLTVVVPAVIATGNAAATKYLSVSKTVSGTVLTSNAVAYTFTPCAATPSSSVVNRIITDYNGYWSSGNGSTYAVNSTMPDLQHSLMAFRYGTTLYSTGSETAITNVLGGSNATTTGTYTTGNWRAIPINSISGNVPSSSSVYIVLAGLIDGSATTSVSTAPSVVGLSARDVLIDGTRGLGLGTGLTNLPSTSPLSFDSGSIVAEKSTDGVPDIMVTQIADPTNSAFTTYCFVDVNGNIVGNPVEINMYSISKLGTYKSDFFTLTSGQSFNTATVNGVGNPGGPTRDIRILAYQLSDFGINETNRTAVKRFQVLTNGTDDMAFMAYNRDTFEVPAPEIANQPADQNLCPGSTATFTVTLTNNSTGTESPTYQWEKNGVAISNGGNVSGATSATLTITNITSADYGIYRCVVTNVTGAAFSNMAYLNSIFLTTTSSTGFNTCLGTSSTLTATGTGTNPQYQWYLTSNNGTGTTTTGGTAISGATSSTYTPPVTEAGTKRYYVATYPVGMSCAPTYSNVMQVTVYGTPVAGTTAATQSTICSGNTASLTLSGYSGTIQWQQSTDNSNWSYISNATAATYTTAALTTNTYYRAMVGSGTCSTVTSTVTLITVTPAVNGGSLPSSQAVCNGDLPGALTLTGYTGNVVHWERSATADFGSYTTINNTTATLSSNEIGTLSATTYFRALVQSGNCGSAYSGVAILSVGSTIWDGTSWSNGFPSGGTAVIFNANYTATSSFAACTLTVQNNAQVVVPSGYTATVQNAVNVATGSSLTFNNNAALVQVNNATNTGNITVHKTTNPLYRLDYTLWSSPVDGQNLFNFSPATASSRFYEYKYDYSENANLYSTVNSAMNFVTAKGFLIRMPNVLTANVTGTTNGGVTTPSEYANGTGNYLFDGVFTGVPHNGTITYPLSTEGNLYTAIGNPYPSPISIIDFFNANSDVMNMASGIYLWRKRNNQNNPTYATLSQAGYVANPAEGGGSDLASFFSGLNTSWVLSQGQGFFVKTKSGVTNPQITFTNSMRRATPGASMAFFKSAAAAATVSTETPSRFWLNLTGDNNAASQTMIGYFNESTLGIDYGYDAKQFTEGGMPVMYSIAEETPLAIQARPGFENSDVVSVGFTTPAAGTFTIALDHAEGIFTEGQKIYVRDNVEGLVRDLTQYDYTFTTEAGTFNTRFEVFYTTQALSTDNPTLTNNNVIVYTEGATIGINSGNTLMNSVAIYDMRGRQLYSQNGINNSQVKISNLTAEQQVLIVEINTVNGKVSKRIVF
ncbi:T9SS sorting signal type C domain-containing protein [Flavobacterium sp. RHBU_3]|uniref:T9SS sorting signal type C domain-containing protein n=1 Tax=Flavobacterium sp. RHBU_3 TaxID=3391184 RepID=UPI00398526DC